MITKRFSEFRSVTLATDATSPEIDISDYATGEIAIPNGSTITTLTYYHAMPSGTYFASQDASGSAVTQTVAADKCYPIPSTVMGGARIQIRANAAGAVKINLKS